MALSFAATLPALLPLLFKATVAILIYLLTSGTYYLFFHPLRRYPGPKLAAATHFPNIYAWVRGRGPQTNSALHIIYGPIVRVGPNELSYSGERAWKDIMSSSVTSKYAMQRDPVFFSNLFDKEATASSLFTPNEEDHRRQRRALSHAFTKPALSIQEPLIMGHVDHLVQELKECSTNATDIFGMYAATVLNTMGDLLFGESFQMQDTRESLPSVDLSAVLQFTTILEFASRFTILKLFISIIVPAVITKSRNKAIKFIHDMVTSRLASKTRRGDLMQHLIDLDSDTALSRPEMDNGAFTILVAGSETTSSLISCLTYLLLKNREPLDILVKEVRSSFKSESEITLKNISTLRYLGACMEEAMRVNTPVPMCLRRIVPPGGASICGQPVPQGTLVSVAPLAMFKSPEHFSKPDSFIPERWLPEYQEEYTQDQKAIFFPFFLGPRDCLGKSMGYYMTRLTICKILWNFDLELCKESEKWFLGQKAFLSWVRTPLMVKMKPAGPHTGLSVP